MKWISEIYYPTLVNAIDISVGYLHTTINWAFSILSAVLLFVIVQPSFPDSRSWLVLDATLVMATHFAVRTGKGYLNIIRWSTIEREFIKRGLGKENKSNYAVENYHEKWKSPLSFKTVVYKVLFELGFIYIYMLIIGLQVYIGQKITISDELWLFY